MPLGQGGFLRSVISPSVCASKSPDFEMEPGFFFSSQPIFTLYNVAPPTRGCNCVTDFPSPHRCTPFRRFRDCAMPATPPLIAGLLEASDHLLLSHANRVRSYAALLAAPLNLSPEDQHALALGAFLHDIGYVALNRWDAGTQETDGGSDRADDLHSMLGVRMTAPLGIPEPASHIIAHHHKRYDGAGHPNGLAGNQIPLLARIVGVAQTFDHLTAQTGQAAMPFVEACEHLGNQAGTALDPDLVELFLERAGESLSAHSAPTRA
ncbi:MAG: HD domain-containing protein [Nitrospiraceae bacterium]|nr:HD domain-containing protein [Nitrospiraceae bacterium]